MSNLPPTNKANPSYSIPENQTLVTTISATDDADAVDAGLAFSIAGGSDAADFVIDAATGQLRFVTAPDYENPTDAGADNVYDLTVRVTDSGGLFADNSIQVQVSNLQTLQMVITSGQSLAIGGTQFKDILSPTPLFPTEVLGMSWNNGTPMNIGWGARTVSASNFKGFAPLIETNSETHTTGMLNALVNRYHDAGLTSPAFLNIPVQAGGYSVLQLMTGKAHIYDTVALGMAAEPNGSEFAVDLKDGTYDFYLNNGGTEYFYRNWKGALTPFDNLVSELAMAVTYANAHGYEVDPTVIFNWIQGQQDVAMKVANIGYEYLLNQLIDRVIAATQSILGPNSHVLSVVSQMRDAGGSWTPLDQIASVLSRPDVIFGAPEYQFEAEYPSIPANAQDFTHLSPTGYYFYGQTIGNKIFDALQGHENTPIIMDKITQVSATSVVVHFTGVNTYLVDDPGRYLAANLLHAPAAFGFGVYTSAGGNFTGFKVANAQIIGPDMVQIEFTKPITGTVRLQLGRNDEDLYSGTQLVQLGGSSLRDATVIDSLQPTNGAVLADPYVYEYAPDQYQIMTVGAGPAKLRIGADFGNDLVGDVLFRTASGAVSNWQLSETGTVSAAAALGNPGAGWKLAATGDFSGDGRTDLLFRNASGVIATWEVTGGAVTGGVTLGNPGAAWSVVGTGYFNADWQSDVLFYNRATGVYASWDIKAGKIAGGGTIGAPGASWVYKATGDFNGDGKSDILFQNANGTFAAWALNDTVITAASGNIGNPGPDWFFKGTGDFNGDGKADLLFENANGTYATWDLNGTAITGGGTIGNPGAAWTLAGIGDYNGDGTSDLLLRHADGTLATWMLTDYAVTGTASLGNPGDGFLVAGPGSGNAFAGLVFQDSASGDLSGWLAGAGSVVGGGSLGSPGTGWTALATGDAMATGETDVLLRDPSGTLALWSTNGAAQIASAAIGDPGADWGFRAFADFNGDGKADILFQNAVTGEYATWDLSGAAITGGGSIGVAAGYTFVAAGDIDGDGKADVIFRNDATGDFAAWLVNDTAITGGGTIGNPGGSWTFAGLGDFNGDGKIDMLFRDASGTYASWDLDGTAITGGGTIGNPGGSYTLAKIADLNQDGKADLVFVDASGNYASWLLADNAIVGGTTLGAVASNVHLI